MFTKRLIINYASTLQPVTLVPHGFPMSDAKVPAVTYPGETGAGPVSPLLAACGFAAVSTLTSIATRQGVSLSVVLLWRYVIGAVVMVVYVGTRTYPRMPWREAARFIVLGGGGQALLVGMALSSLTYIGVATLAFLFYTYPAWVTLVQTVRGAEPVTARRVAALALSFGGIVVSVGMPDTCAFPGTAIAVLVPSGETARSTASETSPTPDATWGESAASCESFVTPVWTMPPQPLSPA